MAPVSCRRVKVLRAAPVKTTGTPVGINHIAGIEGLESRPFRLELEIRAAVLCGSNGVANALAGLLRLRRFISPRSELKVESGCGDDVDCFAWTGSFDRSIAAAIENQFQILHSRLKTAGGPPPPLLSARRI